MNLTDSDLAELHAVAARMLSRLLADTSRAHELADDLNDWLAIQDNHPDHVVAHFAAKTVEIGLLAIDNGTMSHLPREWIERLHDAPVAARVATSLHVLGGVSVKDTAYWCHRPEDRIAQLISMVGMSIPDDADIPVRPGTPIVPTPIPTPIVSTPIPTPIPATDRVPLDLNAAAPPPVPPVPPLPQPVASVDPPLTPVEVPPVLPISITPPQTPTQTSSPSPHAPLFERRAVPPQRAADPAAVPIGRNRRRVRRILTAATTLVIGGGAVASALALSQPPDRPTFRATTPSSLGPSTEATRIRESTGCDEAEAGLVIDGELTTIDVAGTTRQFRMFAPPPAASGKPRGLVVAAPDINEPIELLLAESGIETLATEGNFAVATLVPLGAPPQWNVLGAPDGSADALYASAVVDAIETRLCIDQTRIAVIGKGAGGHFGSALACSEPDRYHLVAMVAGAYRPESCGSLGDSTVVIAVGEIDDVFPTAGGLGPATPSLVGDLNALGPGARYDPPAFEEAVSGWAQDLDCDPAIGRAVFDGPPPSGELTGARLSECRDDSELITISVNAAGHEWTVAASQIIREQLLARGEQSSD